MAEVKTVGLNYLMLLSKALRIHVNWNTNFSIND